MMKNKIVVMGMGYVGLANAVLLAKSERVVAVDINEDNVRKLNNNISPISDPYIENYLKTENLDLNASTDAINAYKSADYVIIATPTDFDEESSSFNTSIVTGVIELVTRYNNEALIVIKSTVPIGFTNEIKMNVKSKNIVFCPEFLREGQALYDSLYPSRIIFGLELSDSCVVDKVKRFIDIMKKNIGKRDAEFVLVGCDEAEAIKLFSNTYLAMRISFFNELDTYAESHGLNSKQIIDGVCLDPRIGQGYNNPSFGYGGYCLPKDTKQVKTQFANISENIMGAIVSANNTRKEYIAKTLLENVPLEKSIGIYRIIMKSNSDNFRESSTIDIVRLLKKHGMKIYIYEPLMKNIDNFEGCEIENNLERFKIKSDCIVANRISAELDDVIYKVYTRDIYQYS